MEVINRLRNDRANPFAQRWKIFFPEILGFNHVVQIYGDGARADQPARLLVEFKRTDDADRDNGRAELQRHAKYPILEWADAAITRSLPFGEHCQAYSGIKRRASEPPHALQIGRPVDVRYGNIAEAFHHPAVHGNPKVRFKLQAAKKLRNSRIQNERIE